ncbi:MAG: DUF4276 family protein [Planctomycetes bacterium]|nr:DUF4276 family protein [Planctomycetota bacterium]
MNSKDVYIVVEGQTERAFIERVLAPYFHPQELYLHATLIRKTGGDIRFERAIYDIERFLKQRPDSYVSTMFDFFRIDSNWPGVSDLKAKMENGTKFKAVKKAGLIEKETAEKIAERVPNRNAENRFIPYLEMHEFEALLFSDIDILSEETSIDLSELKNIFDKYKEPEEINDEVAPSKHLKRLDEGYNKILSGTSVTESIGIDRIRAMCPHFDRWISKLEALSC